MDRFFSKLDLRDIKIDPFHTSFPPDADETAEASETAEPTAPAEPAGFAGTAETANGETDPGVEPTTQSREQRVETAPAVPTAPAGTADWGRPERRPHVPAWAPANAGSAAVATNGRLERAPRPVPLAAEHDEDLATVAVESNSEVLKVSARSRPSAVAGAIAGVVREAGRAEVQAIGAGATNQAVKAVAIARDYLRETGIEAVCLPAFIDITIENEDRTAIRLVVEPR